MALLFCDGCDHYATADILKKWTSNSGGTISSGTGRRSSNSLRHTSYSQASTKILGGTYSSLIVGFSFKVASLAAFTTAQMIFGFYDSGTLQLGLWARSDGTVTLGTTTTAMAATNNGNIIASGAENYFEVKATFANSIAANSCIVRLNGAPIITLNAGLDTQASANSYATAVAFGQITNPPSGTTTDIDDIYVCDASGSVNNDFLGEVRIDTLYPNADGTYSEFTCSTGTSHFALVDETPPNTTDYNSASAVGARDTYNLQPIASVSGTLKGIQVLNAVLKEDSGARTVANQIRSGTTDAVGTSVVLSTSQTYISTVWETDPNTSVAWTESGINALEAGLKVTA